MSAGPALSQLPLLAQIAEHSEDARAKILNLAHDRKSENRRRSIQYLSDGFPRKFCIALLAELLMDKSARVRGFAAGRCCGLALNELLPSIAISRATEKAQTTKFELDLAFHLMRDNFYEYEDCNDYNIVLNFPEEYPARHVWPGQVTKDMVLSEGVEAVRSRIRAENVSLGILRRPCASIFEAVIWYTDFLEIPISHRGLNPHKPMPMTGVPQAMHPSSRTGTLTFRDVTCRDWVIGSVRPGRWMDSV